MAESDESDESAESTERKRGLLDTSVVIDHDLVDPSLLPDQSAIAAVTLAELAAGPHATDDPAERARRQDRLQWAATTWQSLPLNDDAARLYGRVFAATRAVGRTSLRDRGLASQSGCILWPSGLGGFLLGRSPASRTRVADLLIAATAAANGLSLYTRNPADFAGLEEIVDVIRV